MATHKLDRPGMDNKIAAQAALASAGPPARSLPGLAERIEQIEAFLGIVQTTTEPGEGHP